MFNSLLNTELYFLLDYWKIKDITYSEEGKLIILRYRWHSTHRLINLNGIYKYLWYCNYVFGKCYNNLKFVKSKKILIQLIIKRFIFNFICLKKSITRTLYFQPKMYSLVLTREFTYVILIFIQKRQWN